MEARERLEARSRVDVGARMAMPVLLVPVLAFTALLGGLGVVGYEVIEAASCEGWQDAGKCAAASHDKAVGLSMLAAVGVIGGLLSAFGLIAGAVSGREGPAYVAAIGGLALLLALPLYFVGFLVIDPPPLELLPD